MKNKYEVVTLCGSTRFKEEFIEVQKKLTLAGNIVISVGLFGHSGDTEVWEQLEDGAKTATKLMLDDMHKEKIDMADKIFVINPEGYIGNSTWSEICYARMTGKEIEALTPIAERDIEKVIAEHICKAEKYAGQQLDVAQHQGNYFDFEDATIIRYKGVDVLDPWIREDVQGEPWAWESHKDSEMGVDPFEYYGKKNAARFIEEILMRRQCSE